MSSGVYQKAQGAKTGTGASIDIVCGFRPTYVKVVNRGGLCIGEWFDPMPAASMSLQITAGTMTFPTTLGITPQTAGFRVGANTDLNVAGELFYWYAEEGPRAG